MKGGVHVLRQEVSGNGTKQLGEEVWFFSESGNVPSNQSMKPTPPLALRLRANATFCFKWRGGSALSR